ncbi:MAG: hypothetical protein KA116_11390 [Proteobacteria bacterium]|nr:hypothetical protein [Pseudomonadota bacterium]
MRKGSLGSSQQKQLILDSLKAHNNRVISSVGPRYTREVNIQTDYLDSFEPLLRTQKFKDSILKMTGGLDRAFQTLSKASLSKAALNRKKIKKSIKLHEAGQKLLFEINGSNDFPISKIKKVLNKYEDIISDIKQENRNLEEKEKDKKKEESDSLGHMFSKHYDALSQLQNIISRKETLLYNKNILWLRGNAGEGKTHLLCDITTHRMNENKPSIILVGNDFVASKNIWKTLCMHLGLDVTAPKESFLKYIQEASNLFNERVLLVVDAVNEGEGINVWKKQLNSFVGSVKSSRFLSVCLSCRSTYEFFFDLSKIEPYIVELTHNGFQNSLLIAVKEYFSHYQIKYHEIPLVSEFSNPLFLQVYCKTIHGGKETGPYRGHKGMKDIIEKFFYKIDTDIISLKLNYKTTIKPTWAVAKLIAEDMAGKAQDYLTLQDAQTHAQVITVKYNLQDGLLQEMINEGLLIKDGHYEVKEEVIRFSYQKFSDHLIVRYLMNKYFDKEKKTLDLEAPELKKLFEKNYLFEGLILAMSCQVPERSKGVDLLEYLPKHHPTNLNYTYIRGYLDSLIWRDPKTIIDRSTVLKYFNRFLKQDFDSFIPLVLKNLISLSSVPNHPLNADFLSSILSKKNMAQRDYLWTLFINHDYSTPSEDGGITDLVINWGWIDMEKDKIPPESIRLLSFTLSWFLTSSNRFLRDRATKALAKILSENLLISLELISYFSKVDDLYIIERILIATYGASIRSINLLELDKVARCIYSTFFKAKPPLNFLVQYYARNILKLCEEKKVPLKFVQWEKCEHPFGYRLPKVPTKKHLVRKVGDYPKNDPYSKKWGVHEIKSSVLDFGDFSRYVLSGDNKTLPWIDENIISVKDIEKAFFRKLSKDAKEPYKIYSKAAENYQLLERMKSWDKDRANKEEVELKLSIISKLKEHIVSKLTKCEKKTFKNVIDPYLQNKNSTREERHIQSEFLQRYVLWRSLQMYNINMFGAHDRRVNYHRNSGRSPHKVERIGKKYQWLAYFEAVSLFFDNFKFKPIYDYDGDEFLHISQLTYIDHIDPTILIRSKNDRPYLEKKLGLEFRSSVIPAGGDLVAWLKDQSDLIELEDLVSIQDKLSNEWLLIEGHYNFEELTPPEKEKFDEKRKSIFYVINSYLFHIEDLSKVKKFLKETDFIGRWMPENRDTTNPHFGEFGWSDYYKQVVRSNDWQSEARIPFKFIITNEGYLYESGTYDCSMDDSMDISIPNGTILQGMGLNYGKIDGHFVDNEGSIVAFDLSHEPSGIVVQKERFSQFLTQNKLGIFWTVISEKDFLGGGFRHEDWLGRLEHSQGLIFAENSFERIEPIIKFHEPHTKRK